MRSVPALVLAAALACVSLASCAKNGTLAEKRPVKTSLAQYKTCALEIDAERLASGETDASAFEDYLAGRLRDRGVLEPREPMESGTPDVTLRIRVVSDERDPGEDHERVKLVVVLVDTRTGDELGEIEVTGSAGKNDEEATRGLRRGALHRAADEIVGYLADKRGGEIEHEHGHEHEHEHVAAAPDAGPGEDPFAESTGPHKVCLSRCDATAAAAIADADLERATTAIDKTLLGLRGCLDRIGATRIEPAVILRFAPAGNMIGLRIDMGGYEDLLCVDGARLRTPPITLARSSDPRGFMVRCLYHCS